MTPLIRENLRIALKSVLNTRWRSLLTMLGIIIGISSVVTVVGLGEGIKNKVTAQINHLGKNLITVRSGVIPTQNSSSVLNFNSLNLFSGLNSTSVLSTKDLQVVQNLPTVKRAVPISILPGSVAVGKQKFTTPFIIGSYSQIPSVLHQTLQYGDFFSADSQEQNVAVIGSNVAKELFPGQVPLGESFTFHKQTFIIRGVFNQFDTTPLSIYANFNNAIFIPYPIAGQLENGTAPIYEILAQPIANIPIRNVASSIDNAVLKSQDGLHNFTVLTQNQSLAVTSSILNLLTELIAGVAGISLLVGGIGVMNIMLVAVTERTHEIGVRKAVGATNRQILNQFMTEAIVLSVFGGVLGIILSLLIDLLLNMFTTLSPAITWQIVVIATLVSMAVGIIFGITPAWKAAKKDPIDALHYQ